MNKVLCLVLTAISLCTMSDAFAIDELHKKYACTACHQDEKKLVGPAYMDVAAKYAKDKDAVKKLSEKVKKGGMGVWGPVPMPPNAAVPDKDIETMVKSILAMNVPKKK